MNADELTRLIDARFETLSELMSLGQCQVNAIDENRMSDLMRLLSDKQKPIARLTEIGRALAQAVDDDPNSRTWPSPAARQACKERQEQCDQMHLELLAIEADCESRLQTNRQAVEEKLTRFDSSRLAASRYGDSSARPDRGGTLDLSSD